MADLQNIVDNQLTRLSGVGSSPGDLENGTVSLFADPWWHSSRLDLPVLDRIAGERHHLDAKAVDNTTWVAWNLPVGTVVTLTDHHRSHESSRSVGDLIGAGGSVDLVGTGRTETADLREAGVNDIIASWFWREVDLRYGAVELFADPNFTGVRQTLFLSEWEPNKFHNLPGSHMNDNMTAIRWRSLNDNQKVKFWEHPDGGGNSFDDAIGWGNNKENSNFCDNANYFNDAVSCFRWEPVLPKKEIIQPIRINAPRSNATSQTAEETYRNNTDREQQFTVSSSQSRTKTFSVETTQSHVANVKASMTTTAGADVGVAKAEVSYSLEVSYEYTNSTTKKEETSETVEIKYDRQITASPRGITKATMVLQIGDVPKTTYETAATRWYAEKVGGSVRDPSNGLYKREEKTQITVEGGLATSFVTDVSFEPF